MAAFDRIWQCQFRDTCVWRQKPKLFERPSTIGPSMLYKAQRTVVQQIFWRRLWPARNSQSCL